MSELLWTVSEQQALLVAMQHFGACICRPPGHNPIHHPGHVCEGHSFMSETDRRVDRMQHLLYVRRTRQAWIDAEWMHTPPITDPVSQPTLPPVVQASQAAPSPDKLPW